MNIYKFLNNQCKSAIFITMAMGVIFPAAASAETISLQSLKKDGSKRDLCIEKRSSNLKYKKCKDKSAQQFELIRQSNNANLFQLKRKNKCIVAKFKSNINEVKSDIRKNVRIRMDTCTPNNTSDFDGAIYTQWQIDRGNRIRSFNFISTLDICLSDGDKNDKIEAVDCSNRNNPGRFKLKRID